jgi:hypothetical protein
MHPNKFPHNAESKTSAVNIARIGSTVKWLKQMLLIGKRDADTFIADPKDDF